MYKISFNLLTIIFIFMSFSVSASSIENGKSKSVLCASCHGGNGISISPDIPNLAGQKAAYLAKAIRDYKTGARKNPLMASIAPMIADGDIDDIAAYFSSLK